MNIWRYLGVIISCFIGFYPYVCSRNPKFCWFSEPQTPALWWISSDRWNMLWYSRLYTNMPSHGRFGQLRYPKLLGKTNWTDQYMHWMIWGSAAHGRKHFPIGQKVQRIYLDLGALSLFSQAMHKEKYRIRWSWSQQRLNVTSKTFWQSRKDWYMMNYWLFKPWTYIVQHGKMWLKHLQPMAMLLSPRANRECQGTRWQAQKCKTRSIAPRNLHGTKDQVMQPTGTPSDEGF